MVQHDYEHSSSVSRRIPLDCLSKSSITLQKLLAFFDPDRVSESILLEGGNELHGQDLQFLGHEEEYQDAKEELLRAGLVDRDSEDSSLSIPRSMQAAVFRRLSSTERIEFFDSAVAMLGAGFPNTWNTVASHQFSTWLQCKVRLPHIAYLIKQSERYQIRPSKQTAFAELILRYAWNLYEREIYAQSQQFITAAVGMIEDRESLRYASVCMLSGLISLDTHLVNQALRSFLVALQIRRDHLDKDDALIASTLNAISIAYTELGELDEAIQFGKKAIDIRLRTDSDRIGNSYSNMSSTLLRMGKPDEAEEVLKKCPLLEDFTDDTFLSTGNPRFAGDMVLLARIRQRQGRLDDALRLASKALAFRKAMHGNRLKTCDSLQQVAGLLQLKGDMGAAIMLFEESVEIAVNLVDGKGFWARGHFKLSQVFKSLGNVGLGEEHETCAEDVYKANSVDERPSDVDEEMYYDRLVPWMLW